MWGLVQLPRGIVCALGALLVSLFAAPVALAAPANDNFADAHDFGSATLVQVDGAVGTATVEPGEDGYYTSPNDAHSVWYRWTAPRDSQVWISSCGSGDDVAVEVYRGSSLGSLSYVHASDNHPGCGEDDVFGSVRVLQANAGTTYRIRMFSDYLWSDGSFRLRVQVPNFDGALGQTSSRKVVRRGRTVTYRVRATNVGDVAIDPDVVLMMAKPGTLRPMSNMGRYVSVSSTKGSCRRVDLHFGAQPGAICDPGWLAPGESILITARVRPRRTISHTAFLSWRDSWFELGQDNQPGNDSPKKILRTVRVRG